MRRVLEHTIDIHATPEQVWEALTGFDAYSGWNPFMRSVSGAPQVGSKLRIELVPPDGRPIVVSPSVVVADPGRELRWRGALPLGLFTGEHAFVISPAETGARVVHRGWYRGFLVRPKMPLHSLKLTRQRLGAHEVPIPGNLSTKRIRRAQRQRSFTRNAITLSTQRMFWKAKSVLERNG